MELRHLRYFIAVAEEATLVAAAKRLRIAQPALTRQIHDLEKELGAELFERVPRGVMLTPAGEACLDSARHILHQVDVSFEQAHASSHGRVGRCVIAAGARGLSSGLVARIAAFVQATYPGIDLAVNEATMARQWDAVQSGDADIGIGVSASPEYPDLNSEVVSYDVFDSVAIAKTHPLAKQKSLRIAELENETFISWKSRLLPEFTRQREAEFKRIGFKPKARRDMDEVYAVVMLVSSGQGWTLLPGTSTRLVPSNAVSIPLSDFKIPLPHAVIYRAGETRPVVRTVIDVIRRLMTAERQGKFLISGGWAAIPDNGAAAPSAAAIELRHLRYFCAVVEAQSFGRAAEKLELTQPALSRQIRDLENAVGITLLERAARGATPTPAGDSLYRDSRRVLDEAAALGAEAQRARRGETARCLLGAVPSNGALTLMRGLFQRAQAEFPKLDIAIMDYSTPEQPRALRNASIDLGLAHASPLSPAEATGIRRERLINDTMSCALVPVGHELASRRSIMLSELADIPLVFPSRSFQPGMYDEIFAAFAGLAFTPRIEQTYKGLKTIWSMVADGHGWGLGFHSQCDDPPPGTVAIPLDDFSVPWGIDVLMRDDEARSMILRVVDVLHEIARALPQ